MANVMVGNEESFESLLGRFNKKVQREFILSEIRQRACYEKSDVKNKREEAVKRPKSVRPGRR